MKEWGAGLSLQPGFSRALMLGNRTEVLLQTKVRPPSEDR
jgi:hypothetical protein